MKGKKRIIITTLFLINIIMLVVAVIPHHHHPNGIICLKHDMPVEQKCTTHNHHAPGSDSCCDSECMTHFQSPIPSLQTNNGPEYVLIATLFTDVIIEQILRPQEKRIKNDYVYRDSLHGANISRTFSLRAPPYTVLS